MFYERCRIKNKGVKVMRISEMLADAWQMRQIVIRHGDCDAMTLWLKSVETEFGWLQKQRLADLCIWKVDISGHLCHLKWLSPSILEHWFVYIAMFYNIAWIDLSLLYVEYLEHCGFYIYAFKHMMSFNHCTSLCLIVFYANSYINTADQLWAFS